MPIKLHHLGLCDYVDTWQRMRDFTEQRTATTADEVWILQHHAVFTHGTRGGCPPRAGRDIPLVHSDRGGLITYHAPGQLLAYLLLDLRRRRWGAKFLVAGVEKMLIKFLGEYKIAAQSKCGAPGVYVGEEKIAALGFRIRRGCCYHGLSLNVDMDLNNYARIDACGKAWLMPTQMAAHTDVEINEVEARLAKHLRAHLNN